MEGIIDDVTVKSLLCAHQQLVQTSLAARAPSFGVALCALVPLLINEKSIRSQDGKCGKSEPVMEMDQSPSSLHGFGLEA
jgi:hypothetical protein